MLKANDYISRRTNPWLVTLLQAMKASSIFRCIASSFWQYSTNKSSMVSMVSEPLSMSDLLILEAGVFVELSSTQL
jgi:hypothetical protein